MRWLVTAAVVVCGAIGAAGCLAADTSHVLYLRPDGAVTWAVLERDVRSRDDDPLVRAREESEFLAAAGAARHPIGLGPGVRTARASTRGSLTALHRTTGLARLGSPVPPGIG